MLIVPCASIRDLFRVNRERGWDDGGIKVQLINSRSGKTVERGFPSKNRPFICRANSYEIPRLPRYE